MKQLFPDVQIGDYVSQNRITLSVWNGLKKLPDHTAINLVGLI